MNEGPLYDMLYAAWRKNEEWNKSFTRMRPIGGNDWMSNFAYLLNEEIRKKYFVIPNTVKSLEDMLKFIDEKDNE
jgi:hypothetical protein